MNIAAIDYSKNAPGVIKATLDNDFHAIEIKYRGFTSVKKVNNSDENVLLYHKKNSFADDLAKAQWMRDNILEFIGDVDYCAIEGYAMAGKGKVFDIAESTGCTKIGVYNKRIPLRIYEPTVIKLFATGKGNADKTQMGDAYVEEKFRPDISHLPPYKTPSEDIVDAYFGMKLLQMELKLRNGILILRDLGPEVIQIFNRVTKAYPENILVRPFLEKE